MPFAYWCVLAAGLLPILTVGLAKFAGGDVGAIDNRHPRDQALTYEGRQKRAYAAHLNMFEAFPFFAAGTIVAVTQGGPGWLVNLLCATFIVARVAYVYCYVNDMPAARSAAWSVAFFATIGLFVSALFG